MNSAIEDLQAALHQLAREKRFCASFVLCLGLGLAAVAAVGSLLWQVVFAPLPFHKADQLVIVQSERLDRSRVDQSVSMPEFRDLAAMLKTMKVAAYHLDHRDLRAEDGFHRLFGFYVSRNFLSVLEMPPSVGHDFQQQQSAGGGRQILLGTSVWSKLLGEQRPIAGSMLRINSWQTFPNTGDRGYEVLGLLPQDFRFLPGGSFLSQTGFSSMKKVDFCVPFDASWHGHRSQRSHKVVGRLKPGATLAQANAELKLVAHRFACDYPETNEGWTLRATRLRDVTYGKDRPLLKLAAIGAVIVLLIACGNLFYSLRIRFDRRQTDWAIHAAVGATPGRLRRIAALEIVPLVLAAAGVAFVMSNGLIALLQGYAPREIAFAAHDVRNVALVCLVLVTLPCTAAIVMLMHRRMQTASLRRLMGGRTASATLDSTNTLAGLAVGQSAIAFVLLATSSWMVAKRISDTIVELGFEPRHRLTLNVSLPQAKYEWNENTRFCNEVIRRVREIPGVIQAGAIQGMPMGRNRIDGVFIAEGRPWLRNDDLPQPVMRVVTDDYFEAMGIPVLAGRTFGPSDGVGEIGGNRTIIISQGLAEFCWPGENPIGKRAKNYLQSDWIEVIGVVGDVRAAGIDVPPPMEIYLPEKLFPQPFISIVLHTETTPISIAPEVTEKIAEFEPDAFIEQVSSMADVVARSQARSRYATFLLVSLAFAGLLLSVLGTFLSTSFSVARRRHELKIRLACGATPSQIVRLVVAREARLTLIGIAIGMTLVSLFQNRIQLPWDTAAYFQSLTFIAIPVALFVVTATASFIVGCQVAKNG